MFAAPFGEPLPGTTVVLEIQCPHCGDVAESSVLMVDQPEADGRIHIDVELMVGQTEFECRTCNCAPYVGDIDPYLDGECDYEEDESEGEPDGGDD